LNGSASNPRRFTRGAAALLALASSLACRGERHVDAIELVVPDGTGRTLELVPRAAFAEYVEVPDAANELRVTLATFDVSCERYVAPGADDSMLILTLKMPPSEKPHTGSYASTPPLPVDGGTDSVGRAHAVTVVRRGGRGFTFPPGGTLELSEVDLGRSGRVAGTLALEFAGDAVRPASSAKGKFSARLCRSDEAPPGR
jgi:hypothetical protein